VIAQEALTTQKKPDLMEKEARGISIFPDTDIQTIQEVSVDSIQERENCRF
jgi:hypothetical protein